MTETGGAKPRTDGDYVAWNEEMVRRYDIERYYVESHPLVRWLERRRLRVLGQLAGVRPGERLLEVGCGAGHVLAGFPQARRTGIDLSSTMLEWARRRLGAAVPLCRGLADGLPFPEGAFDVVLCTEVLEHTPDPGAVLRELMRVAGPRGRVVVSIPNENRIDAAKHALARVPLLRRALRVVAAEENEWHLHRMDMPFLRRISAGVAAIERVRALPAAPLPLRYAALLRPE